MEINVGDYVRDKNGIVGKVYDITNEPSVDIGIGTIPEVNAVWIDKDKINYLNKEEIIKHSKDIIDLIEVGDVIEFRIDNVSLSSKGYIKGITNIDNEGMLKQLKKDKNYHVLSILTKEQFEANAYKIEKER